VILAPKHRHSHQAGGVIQQSVVVSINSSEKPQSEPFVVQARSEPYADSFLPFSPVGLNLG